MKTQLIRFDELKALLTGNGSEEVARRVAQLLQENPEALITDVLDRHEEIDNHSPTAGEAEHELADTESPSHRFLSGLTGEPRSGPWLADTALRPEGKKPARRRVALLYVYGAAASILIIAGATILTRATTALGSLRLKYDAAQRRLKGTTALLKETTALITVPTRDPYSFGQPDQVSIRSAALDLTVDFDRKELAGVVILDVERQPGVKDDVPLQLDTRDLTIGNAGIRSSESGPFTSAQFALSPVDPILGSRLSITLDKDTKQVRIEYRTAPTASALQWLDPSLTAGKARPFLFTQSEAIHARSWIPLHDSPGARITYSAVVRVPKGLTAVMAADSRVKPEEASQGVFRFVMSQPIPSYLIALAVGDLAFQKLGPRTGVWAEPSVLKSAAYEFGDVEAMVASVEERFGPYRWGRYDILVLPPSFPFGGMENPKLTFATPTILAGDRSLVALIAHELAHSWSGNLVTNATWRDFWLNEGFTTYLERRIVEDLYGTDRAEMEWVLGLADLREELKDIPPRDQVLHIDLTGRDPDEGLNRIPYEKGALFLRTLEKAIGRDRFDMFLRSYFDRFAFRSITTAEFTAYLMDQLLFDANESKEINLVAWLEGSGLPSGFAEPVSARFDAIDKAAHGWLDGTVAADQLGAGGWSTQEWIRFLQVLPEKLPGDRLTKLDQMFGFTERGNAEIAHQWLLIAIRNNYTPANERLEGYLTTIGRRKLVLPLYRALLATPAGRRHAEAIYATARPGYHPIVVESVDRLLKTRL